MKSKRSCPLLHWYVFHVLPKKILLAPRSCRSFPVFLQEDNIVSASAFRFVIYPIWIVEILMCIWFIPSCYSTKFGTDFPSPLNFLFFLKKLINHTLMGIFLDSLYHYIGLCVYPLPVPPCLHSWRCVLSLYCTTFNVGQID